MSGNLLALVKWLPSSILEYESSFQKCISLRRKSLILISRITKIMLKISQNGIRPLLKELMEIAFTLDEICDTFTTCFQEILMTKSHPMLTKKFNIYKDFLKQTKLKLCYVLYNIVCHNLISDDIELFSLTLRFSNCYNNLLLMDTKFNIAIYSNTVCKNTCPLVMLPIKKFSVTKFLQLFSNYRAEFYCHKLIDCLLETYKKQEEQSSDDGSSDNSSIEIYMALTKHLSPPSRGNKPVVVKDQLENTEEQHEQFGNFEKMLKNEETFILKVLNEIKKKSSDMFGKECMKRSKTDGDFKISAHTIEKVLDYYDQILWAEVGDFLEHITLWWGSSPLALRPPKSTQHLKEWISSLVPTANVPVVVLSALSSLADGLSVHITSTLWDQCFRQVLVASRTCGHSEAGKLFCNLLHELVILNNLCEITSDWIVGAPLDELPLVEQISVLHRLDHSIHTTRLWALSECRKIANTWNVCAFFKITHSDIVNCLERLNGLHLPDHSVQIEKGGMMVQVEVCVLMRAKLVFEIKENIQKLKDVPDQSVACLATICKVINLANLQMLFPPKNLWKVDREDVPSSPDSYVKKYLDKIFTPVLTSIDNPVICNMILTLICESWLDHIYNQKIKFSRWGAFQLLCDFAYVKEWIENYHLINETMKKKLLKNEVLRRCEGVGQLLLRCPGEKLKMDDKKKLNKTEESDEDNQDNQQMPAEMYVPNQEQWLELRASKRKSLINPLCC